MSIFRYRGFEYTEPEEIVYDDGFKVSIIDLVYKHKPQNITEFSKMLDNGGYYGRYVVDPIYRSGARTMEINVVVSMIWSPYKYSWPYKGTFSFLTGQIKRAKELKPIDIHIEQALYNLLHNYGSSVQPSRGVRIPKRSEININLLLEDTKVLTSEGFHISNKTDLKEFKHNVLGFKI
jgi:hypothetical protein